MHEHCAKPLDYEAAQRKAARFVHGDYRRRASPTNMLNALGWNTLEARRRDTRLPLMYNITNNNTVVSAEEIGMVEADGRTKAIRHFKFRAICIGAVTAVLLLVISLDKKETVDMAILDFTKAFDKVPLKRLIHKLNYYGISGSIATWMETFLIRRTQHVVVNGATSSSTIVTSGVPQGTVLEPILFLLYINYLPDNISTSVRLFADYCILYTPIRTQNDSSLLQDDLLKLQKWQDEWLMKFNPGKGYTMPLATRTPTTNMYTLCGQTLTSVDSHGYLGNHQYNTLNWTAQTKAVSTKAQQTLGVIRRNLNKCPAHIKAVAYTSLVRPILEYVSAAWDPHSQNNIKTLEIIQRQAARFCTNNYSSEPGSVTELGWETLQTRRKSKRITTLYKMEHNIIDIPLDQYIKHNTRCSRKYNSQATQ